MGLPRVLPIFVLPRLPRRAAVLGSLPSWRDGLEQSRIELVEPEPGLDLVVAPAALAAEAIALAPECVVLEGRARPQTLRRAGYGAQTLLALPGPEAPEVLLPLGQHEPVRYALGRLVGTGGGLRKLVAAPLLERGIAPPGRPATVVAARTPGPPALLAAAGELLPAGLDPRWLAVLGRWGDPFSRGVLLLFPPGSPEPRWALKFARVPGNRRPFDLDAQGLGLAAAAGGVAAAHAPRLLGRLELDGLAASLETASTGRRLLAVLAGPEPRAARLAHVERIAGWIAAVAGETRGAANGLAAERRRLAAEVVPRWADRGAPADLVDRLPQVSSVLEHGDLWPDNILVDGDSFSLLDWESARTGLPLWDGLYFLPSALAILDGVASEAERDEHFLRLFRGELPSSAVLFDWTRRLVAASNVPPEAVGPLATLRLLSLGLDDLRHAGRVAAAGGIDELPVSARMAARWLADPQLGPGWDRWR